MRHNIAILGLPRSGKTTKAREMFINFAGSSIFINTQNENYFDIEGITNIRDFKQWNPAIRRCVISPDNRADLMAFIDKLFANQQKSKSQIQPIRIIIDEIFHYQNSQDDKYRLQKLVVDGLRWNIQTIITAHMPTMVDSKIYKNIHLYYFFELNNAIYDYFKKTWRIDLFPFSQYLSEPGKYHYILYDMRRFYKSGDAIAKK